MMPAAWAARLIRGGVLGAGRHADDAGRAAGHLPALRLQGLDQTVGVGVVFRAQVDVLTVGAQQAGDRAAVQQFPEPDHHKVLADRFDFAEQMRGDHHRPAGRAELSQQGANLDDAGRVQSVGRLVEDQQCRIGQ
ncbi:hypothetical protein ACFQX7_35865 [Luedemannella flava]